ncbi:peptidogalycan biosysnthesis protein [Macrococcus carouselicus]|uniref:GNAT family N-acetyltransferase n=1 Tax=Macrococcus carouselicus TaxID=69969 RepID=A0A9Q8FPF3_9STAP|nr:GNAT family N-acetyltransferase [Macrococcus carouselicus]TDM00842.1 GNAT family N-acetyltransferase [Macrococcus carouselicus]
MIYTRFEAIPFEQVFDSPVEKAYLKYRMKGVEEGITNVHAKVEVLLIEGQLIPYSVKTGGYKDSWIHSFTGQYIEEMVSEVERMEMPVFLKKGAMFLLAAGRLLLRGTREKTVTLYPSFMSTTLYTEGQLKYIGKITDELTRRYRRHALVFRTISDEHMKTTLEQAGYEPLISRAVYIFDSADSHNKNERKDLKKDIKRLEKSGLTVTDQLNDTEFEQLIPLYNQVYLDKYSRHNPHYTADFFRFMYQHMPFKWFVLKKGEVIVSFMAVQQKGDMLFPVYFGMDQSYKGLYFMTSGLLYQYAKDYNLKINNSAGAKAYKLARGSRPHLEYHLVYTKHLPVEQRIFYDLFMRCATPIGEILLKKLQFK